MPVICKGKILTFSEPTGRMTAQELRDYYEALKPHRRAFPITVERKMRDIEFEMELRTDAAYPET